MYNDDDTYLNKATTANLRIVNEYILDNYNSLNNKEINIVTSHS